MKRIITLLTITTVLALLNGCAQLTVNTTVTPFYIEGYVPKGNLYVVGSNKDKLNTLEYKNYKKKFETNFVSKGYNIVATAEESDYIALIEYGIDSGQMGTVSTPIFGQTGGGTTYTSGYVGNTGFSGSSYAMPTFGMVGSVSQSQRNYVRAIAIDVVETESFKTSTPNKILELRSKSSGICSAIAAVIDEMLEATFKEFPGKNGESVTLKLRADADC